MKVRRDIASMPVRSAAETWQAIVGLITGDGSVDAATLNTAASVMESLIADEHPATCRITVHDVAVQPIDEEERAESAAQAQPLAINWGVLDQS